MQGIAVVWAVRPAAASAPPSCTAEKSLARASDTGHGEVEAFSARASIANRQRHLQLDDTDQVWVGDVTYLRVRQQWRYMAVVMDKYSRRLLGWSLSKRRDAELTRTALQHALRRRRPEPGLIFHTDRGIEYGAFDYQAALRRHGIVQSMNRPGQMNDNAHMESFFHSLKSEFLWGKQFDSDDELRQTLHTYLQYYNHTRLHSSLGHSSPATFERAT